MRGAFLIAAIAAALVTPGAETHGLTRQTTERVTAPLRLEGGNSGIRVQTTTVARDAKSFAALWKQHAGDSKPPPVDFKKYDVVAVFAGEKRTGGHSVRIDSVKRAKRAATVVATLLSPGPGMMATMNIT